MTDIIVYPLIIIISLFLFLLLFISFLHEQKTAKLNIENFKSKKSKIKPSVLIVYNNSFPYNTVEFFSNNFRVIPKNTYNLIEDDILRSKYIIILDTNINYTNYIEDKLFSLSNKLIISGRSENLKKRLKMVNYSNTYSLWERDVYNITNGKYSEINVVLGYDNIETLDNFTCIGGSEESLWDGNRTYACYRTNVLWLGVNIEDWIRTHKDDEILKKYLIGFILG